PGGQLARRVGAAEEDGHQERRELLVGDAAVSGALDQERQLGGVKQAAVALLADQVVRPHERAPCLAAAGASTLSNRPTNSFHRDLWGVEGERALIIGHFAQ